MEGKLYFSKVIADYQEGRSKYPKEISEDIISYSGIGLNSKLLEVGAGPGTATDDFTDYFVDALEISEEQVMYLKKKYEMIKNIRPINKKFEDLEVDRLYDLIYSATAFHWIQPDIAYSLAAQYLKKGGTLAVFWNVSFGIKNDTPTYQNLQLLVRKHCAGIYGEKEEAYADSQKLKWMQYIRKTGLYSEPICKEYCWMETYTADKFISYLKSLQSNYHDLKEEAQQEIRQYFERYGGTLELPQVVYLILVKKKFDEQEIYTYKTREECSAVYDLRELGKEPDILENHFLNYGDEILYITDGLNLYGVVSIRDLVKYYKGITKYKINRNFKSLQKCDFKEAADILKRMSVIHEIPVIENGEFKGIIYSGKKKSPVEWKKNREELQRLCMVDKRLSFNDLFKSLTKEEQEQLLQMRFAKDYVTLFAKEYESQLME